MAPDGPLIFRKSVIHWITKKPIYPVHAKFLAFRPKKKPKPV
jgi:hypothetical protein